jgi:polysaccharide pyruvyl transferase WcaK-like protein
MKACIINQHTENWGDEAAFLGFTAALNDLNLDLTNVIINSTQAPRQGYISSLTAKVNPLRFNSRLEKVFAFLILKYQFLFPLHSLFKRYRKLLAIIDSNDLICVGPGGENIGAYKDYFYLFTILAALKRKKKVVFAGSSFNTSGNPKFDQIALTLLSQSRVLAREEISFNYLSSIGVAASLCSDNALYLKRYYASSISSTTAQSPHISGIAAYTVFVPNCLWTWHPKYKDAQSHKYLTWLIDNIFQSLTLYGPIVVLPQTYPYPNNKEAFHVYVEKYNALVLPDVPSLDQINIISKSQAIVGMRYHTIVFAALASTRCFSIAYERKVLGFNRKFFHGCGLLDISDRSAYDLDFSLPSINQFPRPNTKLIDEEIKNLYSLHKRLAFK